MASFDVIVPCYNYGRFLRQAAESVLSQNVDFRLLIIDDASQDESDEVGQELARQDPRVTFRRHAVNAGHIDTYNEGIDWVRGDYCTILSADDLLMPGALPRAAAAFAASPEMVMVYGRTLEFNDGVPIDTLLDGTALAEPAPTDPGDGRVVLQGQGKPIRVLERQLQAVEPISATAAFYRRNSLRCDARLVGGRVRARSRRARARPAPPLFPRVDEPAPRRDRHPRAPRRVRRSTPASVVERARAAGVHARRHDRHRHRLVPSRARDRGGGAGRRRCARDRPAPGGDAGGAAARRAPRPARASARGRRRRDGSRRPSRRGDAREQRVLFDAQLALAEELELPVVVHSRAASEETAAALAPFGGTVILHCFSEPDLLEPALERGYYVSFAGNVTYPKAEALRAAAARVPSDRILAETDSPYLAPQPVRGRPNEPMHVVHTLAALAEVRGQSERRARGARSTRTRRAAFGLDRPMSAHPEAVARPALPRRSQRARRHRAARDLDADDVVLEVGPGLGVLTTFLADRVRARPCDRARPVARAGRSRTRSVAARTSRFASRDALALDLGALAPPPTKLVANLPYNVATPIVVETLLGVPTLRSWCVMVQREVADRFFAAPGSKAYGAVCVLVRLHARRTGFHPVARTVFRPPPNVDSALVAFERIPPPADGGARPPGRRRGVRPPPQDARELARARRCRAARQAVAALERSDGRPRSARRRSSRTSSSRSRRRCAMSDWLEAPAQAKVNLALVVGPLASGRQARGA